MHIAWHTFLPSSLFQAIDLVDEAGASKQFAYAQEDQGEGEEPNMEVTADDVASVLSTWTGIPVNALSSDESSSLLQLEDRLHERVIGQNEVKGRAKGTE